jgi:hypothetical protein
LSRCTYLIYELHGQTDLRLEIMKLNVINVLVYINSASNNTSSASVMLCYVMLCCVIVINEYVYDIQYIVHN